MKSITAMFAFTCVAMIAPLALLGGTVATQSVIDYATTKSANSVLMDEAHAIGHITAVSVEETYSV